ncbi:TadE family type IV pilus minor pilin [Actinophytocola sp. NPDC049390]|uniref:TadE family type IV pilus minor pilin n=1 Tax=Actinophytocola sp. NPDC049390 TaxID=3363894 RepID=UPI00379A0125
MPAHRRTRRRLGDRGGVTVETAIAISAFVLVLGMALGGTSAMADQVRCVDAAREAARLTARGEQDQARAAAERIAPQNAEVTITMTGEHIEVHVNATPVGGLLPGLRLHASAFAVREPDG